MKSAAQEGPLDQQGALALIYMVDSLQAEVQWLRDQVADLTAQLMNKG